MLGTLAVTPTEAWPSGNEARRILTFFMSSLSNKQLKKPPPLVRYMMEGALIPIGLAPLDLPPMLIGALLASRLLTSLSRCLQHEMASWTTLTPLYEEDVLYALDAPSLARELLGDGASTSNSARGIADLLTETEDKVSLMAYLRSVYPKDWESFKERLGEQLGGLNLTAVTEADFAPGSSLHELGLHLQLWASLRCGRYASQQL